jgi:hypothetical protein
MYTTKTETVARIPVDSRRGLVVDRSPRQIHAFRNRVSFATTVANDTPFPSVTQEQSGRLITGRSRSVNVRKDQRLGSSRRRALV